jgi:predicted glycosyltransferase
MVYSHDAFGLGNIRRMLAICQYLVQTVPDITILVVSGSPALHSLRLPSGVDYIKLPCVGRDQAGELTVKFLETEVQETIKLRSEIILAAATNFKPDLFLVDKKPDGLQGELKDTLAYVKANHPATKLVLLLRDILDCSDVTIQQWQRCNYYQLVEWLYDQVWVIGTRQIFDVCQEYAFPKVIADKVRFCGYIRRSSSGISRSTLRSQLGIQPQDAFVLVTAGGGGDGFELIEAYLMGLAEEKNYPGQLKSLIVSGPEMPLNQRQALLRLSTKHTNVQIREFTDDLINYMSAADLVVSMAGHNTISEILSLRKRAIVVPRVAPVAEQWIRAERMAKLGLFKVIHPQHLTAHRLIQTVLDELVAPDLTQSLQVDMQALPRILNYLSWLLSDHQTVACSFRSSFHSDQIPHLATADR